MLRTLTSSLARVPALLSLAAAACLSAQTTISVGPGQPYTTIQSGIDAANTGDTVLVAPGTYFENIDFKGKAITVTSSGGAADTIIDGGGVGSTVTLAENEPRTAVLSNFTITHGGLGNQSSGSPAGAGISIVGSAPTILNNVVTRNYCQNIQVEGGAPLLQNNTISYSLIPSQCSVQSTGGINISGAYSGPPLSPVILGNTIENNTTGQVGDGGGDGGAGIWTDAGNAIAIVGNIIRNNTTVTGSGGGILTFNTPAVAIINNLIYGNSAGCGGGAIAFQATTSGSPYDYLIANNTIVDNTSTGRGGYSNCTAIAQIYPNPYSYGTSSPASAIINNIISGSTPYPAVNCSMFGPPSESIQPIFQNNILYNAGGPFFGSFCIDVSSKYNNVVTSPQFVDPSTFDDHVKSRSPAVDAGLNSVIQNVLAMTGFTVSTDLDGNPRVQDETHKGAAIIDMGAYESVGAQAGGTSETLTSSLSPSTYGASVTLSAVLSSAAGTPTGSIQFNDGSTVLGVQAVSGTGTSSFSTSSLAVGSHPITAVYQPTGGFTASTAALTQVVTDDSPSSSTTTLTCNPSTLSVNTISLFSVAVSSSSGVPTGTILITDNGAALTTLTLANGMASYSFTARQSGTRTIVATYVPAGSLAASSASCVLSVSGFATISALSVSPTLAAQGDPITLTASVSGGPPGYRGSPVGSVTFYNGSTVIEADAHLITGTVSFTTSSLPPGIDYLTCTYSGNATFSPSSCNTVAVTITQSSSAITLASSLNPALVSAPITFTAQVAPGSGGSIVFNVNGQNITTTPNAAGTSTYSTSFANQGRYLITASYFASPGSLTGQSSLEQIVSLPLAAPDFLLTGSNTTVTIDHTTTGQLLLAAQGTFSGSVALTCNPPYPPGYTCTIQSPTVSLPSGFSTYVTYTLTPHYSASIQAAASARRVALAALLPFSFFGLLGFARKRRKTIHALLCLLILFATATITTACGPDHFIPLTAGTYPLTFTGVGTSQNAPSPITHSVIVEVTIAP